MWALSESVFTNGIHPFAVAEGYFSSHECEKIIELGLREPIGPGLTGGGRIDSEGNLDSKVRKCKLSWIGPSPESEWLFRKLTDLVVEANKSFFNFDLSGFEEGLQFTIYDGNEDMYKAHTDASYGGTLRKLSLVIQLSDPEEYEGGDLYLYPGGLSPDIIKKKKGMVTLFPSWVVHSVQPVTSGKRYSLVVWVNGPQFK